MSKPLICKSHGKANGFESCGKSMTEFEKKTYGMCNSCLWDFYHNDERGKVIYQKSFLPKVSLKLKSIQKENEKQFKAKLKNNIKTLGQYEAEAKKSFQKYVRLRDAELNCISCGGNDKDLWDGGHYFKAELFSGLIFNEMNCHKQCRKCNRYLNGNEIQYRFGLISRYGLEYVTQLESISAENRVYKYTKDELKQIKTKYDLLCKQFNK